jgi:1-acyl-sn-glycerol-3-phosphate acyltransferase
MILVRTILILAFTILTMLAYIPLGIPAFLLSFLGLKKPMSWLVYKCAQAWARSIIAITGSRVEVEGRENIPKKGSVCFVSNHVGIFDIILTIGYIGRPFGFIAKKELIFLPFINIWIYLLGGLFIDRVNIRKAIKTMNRGTKKIQRGEGMLIFPEGTRSKGQGLLPFRSGALKLATSSLAPIVPIAISGSWEVFEKYKRFYPAPVRLVFCPRIITADMTPEERKLRLADQIRAAMEEALI